MNSKRRNALYLTILVSIASCTLFIAFSTQSPDKPKISVPVLTENTPLPDQNFPYEIGKSHTFKNLQIFFLTIDEPLIDKEYTTLSEAMEKSYIKVFETENVNELAVENTSEHYIFIYAGEIVKGGKQDRTLGKDIILPPKSGKVPLASFCVESGRWHAREAEVSDEFSSSVYVLSSRELKVAAKKSKSQGEVWNNVSRQQEKVNESMVANYDYDSSFDVKDDISETSLQLTLENKDLQKVKAEYEHFIQQLDFDKNRTVGFVYAVNGEIYGIDLFHNYKLFNDLWSKLADAIIVEAIAEKNQEEINPIVKEDILSLINVVTSNRITIDKEEINSETTYRTTTTDQLVKFETFDKREDSRLLHLNYITLGQDSKAAKTGSSIEDVNLEAEQLQLNRINNR